MSVPRGAGEGLAGGRAEIGYRGNGKPRRTPYLSHTIIPRLLPHLYIYTSNTHAHTHERATWESQGKGYGLENVLNALIDYDSTSGELEEIKVLAKINS